MHKDRLRISGAGNWLKSDRVCEELYGMIKDVSEIESSDIIGHIRRNNGKHILFAEMEKLLEMYNIPIKLKMNKEGYEYVILEKENK